MQVVARRRETSEWLAQQPRDTSSPSSVAAGARPPAAPPPPQQGRAPASEKDGASAEGGADVAAAGSSPVTTTVDLAGDGAHAPAAGSRGEAGSASPWASGGGGIPQPQVRILQSDGSWF